LVFKNLVNTLIKSHPVTASIGIATLILFTCSSVRHWLYQSHGFDLGIFDQAIYLISTSQNPIISFLGFHILGDHAAIIFYPLSLLYRIHPDVHWLFAIQAIALTSGGFPLYHLSLQSGLNRRQATTIVFAYLLYPLIINKSLYDFHPEVIAVPGFLVAVLAARNHKIIWFCLAIALILSCKAVLSLTVMAMGLWLMVCERKRMYGAIALGAGLGWFTIATQFIIPTFSGAEAAAVSRYSYLGSSVLEIAQNLVFKPNLAIGKIFSLDTLEYLFYLTLPVLWGLSPKYLSPLLSAVPMLLMNILSTVSTQRNLIHQYSLPILPFLFLAVISAVASDRTWVKTRRNILIWSTISFIILGKVGYFWSTYLSSLDTNQATTIAISKISDNGALLTNGKIAPHLTHRPIVKIAFTSNKVIQVQEFKYILLNRRHPGWNSNTELVNQIKTKAETSGLFQLDYQQDDVYLFTKK
jgi:uncharacterized membrane protein